VIVEIKIGGEMRHILIAIDGSKHATNALEYVVVRRTNGEKIKASVLYVQLQPLVRNSAIDSLMAEDRDKVMSDDRARRLLKSLRATPQFRVGDPAKTIVKAAAELKCDEIVLGSRGQGNVHKFLLGSVASKVVQLSKLPVTLVK